MNPRVAGLGHVGIYVRDLEKMTEFYRDFLGLTVTKINPAMVFFSSDPMRVDHEIVIMAGRPSPEDPRLINQISLRVPSLADLREFRRRIIARGYKIVSMVTHVSAIGCYFSDPEGNTTELYWLTGLPAWVPIGVQIDIERPDADVMAEVHNLWDQIRHVGVGQAADPETAELVQSLSSAGIAEILKGAAA
jgi:catechol-2,3-dioxygenase